jgi:putative nucleotidyltransferase with HDIG domain
MIKKKVSVRRQRVRETIASERFGQLSAIVNSPLPAGLLILVCFIAAALTLLGLDTAHEEFYIRSFRVFKPWPQIASLGVIVGIISLGSALYIYAYQPRIIARPSRSIALATLFLLLLAATRSLSLSEKWMYLATGSAAACAIVLTIAYDQRFAIGMTMFYAILACFAVGKIATIELFLTMMAGIMACCFSLREIRTRKKLIEVSIFSTLAVFITSMSLGVIQNLPMQQCLFQSGAAAGATFAVGVIIQAFLPIIESAFGIATSMTLLDYSDANQPLLRKLALDAPGTFSHSLLIGSIAEAAAESISANGLLCRVGAYYHDIGKVNKPTYFIENQMGLTSRHEQLSPAMSQLVIVGHVKDGIEIAKEFGLPSVLRQFIETHHGTTLMEYFYNEARKKQDERQTVVSESEFRYPGPKPRSKEAAIVMLADAAESAARTLTETSPTKVETLVHTIAMKRLQDGQFDECELTLRELSRIEVSLSKSLAAHHHGRIPYPKQDDSHRSSSGPVNGKTGIQDEQQ